MKKIILLSVWFSALVSFSTLAAEAYIVQADRSIALINDSGEIVKVLSKPDYAFDVSYGSSGKLWALTTNVEYVNQGGNTLAYHLKGKSWQLNYGNTMGEEAHAVSAHVKHGKAWFIDGQGSKVKSITLDGAIHNDDNLPSSGFLQISAETTDTVWAISEEATADGNPVMFIKPGAKKWTVVEGVTGTRVSSGWVVTHDGKVVYVKEDGSVQAFSDEDFARDVSVGPSGRVWATTHEPHGDGGSTIKIMSLDRRGVPVWETVPNIGARRISAK